MNHPAGGSGGGVSSTGGSNSNTHKKPGVHKNHSVGVGVGGATGFIRNSVGRPGDRGSSIMGPSSEDILRVRSRDNSSGDEEEGDFVDTSLAPQINIAKYTGK